MLLFSHPTFNHTVRHTAHAVSQAGVLGEVWTCLTAPDRYLVRQLSAGALLEAAEPCAEAEHPDAAPLAPASVSDSSPLTGAASSLDRAMSARLETEQFSGVYAYEDGAEESFRTAGRRGLLRIYDLPMGHWRSMHAVLAEEALREPAWADTLMQPPFDLAAADRTKSELEQADLVLVGSTFALRTIEQTVDIPAALAVVPPSVPRTGVEPTAERRSTVSGNRLRVLFAGALGQRAGLSYLFRACRELGTAVTLTVIGDVPPVECPTLVRELSGVRWLPRLTPSELRLEMTAHDVFVFPAIYDGRAELLLEAMAMGLPIVATPHSAAPDLIRDGEEGFIVPVRSAATLVEKLELLHRDPARREAMSLLAQRRAGTYTWERFEQTVAASVASALGRR